MKKIRILLFALFLVTISTIEAQVPKNTGLVFNDKAYDKVPHLPVYEGKKYNEVPLAVSLRPYCPVPGDQGEMASCVGWACGYGGLTINKAIKLGITKADKVTSIAHSALYIYNQILLNPGDCESGAHLDAAFRLLKNQGDCLATNFNDEDSDCQKETKPLKTEAAKFKIKDYAAIFNHEDKPKTKILQTKKSLANDKPVVIGMQVTTSFYLVEEGQKRWSPDPKEETLFAHAMIVVGYDDVEKEFEIMNSFGTDWGDGGFIYIKYKDFAKFCKYGMQMILPDVIGGENISTTEHPNVLQGVFEFRNITGYQKDGFDNKIKDEKGDPILAYDPMEVFYHEKEKVYYEKNNKAKLGDKFQLVTQHIPTGKNVYVFSIDPENTLRVHWPKKGLLPWADYVPSENVEIIIPSKGSALQIGVEGTNILCVLYSDFKITEIEERNESVQDSKGTIYERLAAGYGDLLIAPDQINYKNDVMDFNCVLNKQKKSVVPLILVVNAGDE